MTSNKESSVRALPAGTLGGIETLGGVVHPFDIEVQDFDVYALVLDVREAIDYAQDHVPGAIRLSPEDVPAVQALHTGKPGAVIAPSPGTGLPPSLETLLVALQPDASVLVYCGRGGRDSLPVASLLRTRGLTVDVLPGGWINYRRWVTAGIDLLPRLVEFKMLSTALDSEAQRVLAVLSHLGHQVIDIDELARQALLGRAAHPAAAPQAFFESLLLQSLRGLDPRRAVWLADAGFRVRGLEIPGALQEALDRCPVARLLVPKADRLAAWSQDRMWAAWAGSMASADTAWGATRWLPQLLGAADALPPSRSDGIPTGDDADRLRALACLADERAAAHAVQLPALAVSSLDMAVLSREVQLWAPPVALDNP